MGPKKKKAGKKGKEEEQVDGDPQPKSYGISRQMDRDQIDNLTSRVVELIKNNNELRGTSSRSEKDTHDIVLYFQREVEMKDDIISRLNEELVKRETQLKNDVERLKRRFEDDITVMRSEMEQTISDLNAKLITAQSDLSSVELYVLEKKRHDERLLDAEQQVMKKTQQMYEALEDQERKFLEEKSQMYKDLDEQKAHFKLIAQKEARSIMGDEAKRLEVENIKVNEELKFHQTFVSDLQQEKNSLQLAYNVSKRDVSILTEKETEYAKIAHYKTAEIRALRERVEHLEKQQILNTEKFTQRTKELQNTVKRELEEANIDASGLRRLMKIKTQELKQMRNLAATILSQRSETEQFFLESLQEVRDMIKAERKRSQRDAKVALDRMKNGQVGDIAASGNIKRLPSLAVKQSALHLFEDPHAKAAAAAAGSSNKDPSAASSSALRGLGDKVLIRDLSWEDKELVLRILFAKMNGSDQMKRALQQQQLRANTDAARYNSVLPAAEMQPFFVSEGSGVPGMSYKDSNLIDFATAFEVNTGAYSMDDRLTSAMEDLQRSVLP